jgi:sugar lactone lactonase YvrE
MSVLSDVTPVQAVLERSHSLLEGPRIAASGALVYSDVLAGGVFECDDDGTIGELLAGRRGVGGIVPHARGGWVLSGRSVVHVAADGVQRELLAEADACGYNDLGATADGSLLAGVLRFRPMAGEAPREGRLVLLSPGRDTRVLSEQVVWPNGIGVSPDARTVYVSDYARQLVLAVALGEDERGEREGHAGNTRVFARIAPGASADGLAVDVEGGVWVALGEGGGVARFDSSGTLDETIAMPARFVSSIAFGGADMRDVVISTADSLVQPESGGMLLRARSAIAGLAVSPVTV